MKLNILKKNFSSMLVLSFLFLLLIHLAEASACGTLTSTTTLNSNVNSSGTCFTINANNIILNCAGYTINYSQSATGYGITNIGFYINITIKNCNIVQGSASLGSHGIYLDQYVNDSIIQNNSITTFGTTNTYGLYFDSTVNSRIIDSTINTTGTTNTYGVYFDNAINNTIINSTINTNGTTNAYGVYFDNAVDNMVINSTINAVNSNDIYDDDNNTNVNYLINSSFSKSDVVFSLASIGKINVKWYLDVNITDGTSPLQNAEVKGYNNTNGLVFTNLTQANGFIDRQILTEYIQNFTGKYYQTNYTINANKTGYASNSTQVNLTQSRQINLVLQTGSAESSTSKLVIWDSTDPEEGSQEKYPFEQVDFYANYTNITSGASINGSGVYCGIMFYDSANSSNMTYNTTSLLYQYNRTFDSDGVFEWNATCNGTIFGYDVLTSINNVIITSGPPPPAIPEFSPLGILLAILIIFVVGGRITKKKN